MGSSAPAPAPSTSQAGADGSALANQAMLDSLRTLEPVSLADTAFDTLDDQAMSRKLALLRQDMAGFGGRFAETSRDWRNGDGLRAIEFFA